MPYGLSETGALAVELELDVARWAVALLGDDDLGGVVDGSLVSKYDYS